MPGWLRRALMVLLGMLASAVALALAFYRPARTDGGFALVARFDFRGWVADLPSHAAWLLPFVGLSALLPALRAHLWGYTAPAPPPRFGVRYHALAVGALVHNTLPARLGLLVTAWFAARRVGRPMVELLASLLVAKLVEVTALVLAIALSAPLVAARAPGGGQLGRTALGGFALVAALAVLLVAVAVAAPRLAARLRASGKARRLQQVLAAVATGVRGVGSPLRLLRAFIAGHGPIAAAGLAYGIALAAVGAEAGVAGGWLLLGAITLGQFTPGLPVGTGVYLLACTWAARALGASEAEAAALSVLSHVATVLTNLGVGLVSALLHRQELAAFMAARRRRDGTVSEEPHGGTISPM